MLIYIPTAVWSAVQLLFYGLQTFSKKKQNRQKLYEIIKKELIDNTRIEDNELLLLIIDKQAPPNIDEIDPNEIKKWKKKVYEQYHLIQVQIINTTKWTMMMLPKHGATLEQFWEKPKRIWRDLGDDSRLYFGDKNTLIDNNEKLQKIIPTLPEINYYSNEIAFKIYSKKK